MAKTPKRQPNPQALSEADLKDGTVKAFLEAQEKVKAAERALREAEAERDSAALATKEADVARGLPQRLADLYGITRHAIEDMRRRGAPTA